MIEIVGNYTWLPDEYRYQGKYYLDINPNDIRISDKISNSIINSIDIPSALGLSIKMTPRNIIALEPFIHGQSGKYSGIPCRVLAYLGDQPLPLTYLYVLGSNDVSGIYTCELRHPDNHWIELADRLKIKDIKLPKINFSKKTINDDNNLGQYTAGDSPYRYPHVNWGQLNASASISKDILIPNEMWYHEMRPFVCLTYLLLEGARQCGVNLKSPVFDTYWGRRLIVYLLRSDYGKNDANNQRRYLSVFTEDIIFYSSELTFVDTIMPFTGIGSDMNGNWVNKIPMSFYHDPNFYYYRGPGFTGEIYTRCTLDLSAFSSKPRIEISGTLSIWIESPILNNVPLKLGETQLNVYEYKGILFKSYTFELRLSDQEIPPDSKLYVKIFVDKSKIGILVIQTGAEFRITPDRPIYSEGDTINMSDELDQEMTYLELLKGAAHLVNGKFYQRMNSATVWLLPTFATKVYETETEVEGYFKNNYVDITKLVVPKSLKRKSGNAFSDRNIRVGFARSNDPYIDVDNDNDIQSFDAVYYEPRKRKSIEVVSRNPVFEPTINKSVIFINNLEESDPLLRRGANDLPFITDNKDGKTSYSVGKRILYYHGKSPLKRKTESGELVLPGLLYQNADTLTAYSFDKANLVHNDGSDIKENVIYGESISPLTDLFNQFWKRSIIEIENGTLHELLVYMGGNLSFRDIIYLEYKGHGYTMRLQEISDWDGGISGLSTPLTLIPTKSNLLPGSISDPGLEIRSDCDSSGIVLDYTESGGCYSAEIGGSSPIPILSTTFSYKYETDNDWTDGNTICEPTGTFIFRMVVEFDEDCDPVTLTKTVVPCDNNPIITFTYDPLSKCLTIEADNTDVHSEIDTTVITYSIDGGSDITYTSPICDLSGVSEITATLTQSYLSGCNDSYAEGTITFPVTEFDCTLNDPTIGYDNLADCKIYPKRTGDVIEEIIIMDTILYRYSVDSDWQIWDENTPIDKPVHLRRVILFDYCNPATVELDVS